MRACTRAVVAARACGGVCVLARGPRAAAAAAAAAGRPTDGPASGRAPARTWRHMLDDDPADEAIELLLVLNL